MKPSGSLHVKHEKALNFISFFLALILVSPVLFYPIRPETLYFSVLMLSLMLYSRGFPKPNGFIVTFFVFLMFHWLYHVQNPRYLVALSDLGQIDWHYGLLWPMRAMLIFIIVAAIFRKIVTARFFLVALSVVPLVSFVLILGHLTSLSFVGVSHEVFSPISGRFYGLHNNPNYFAFTLLGCLSISILLLFNSDKVMLRRKTIYIVSISAFVNVGMLLVSGSRGAIIALTVLGVISLSQGSVLSLSNNIRRGTDLILIGRRSLAIVVVFLLFFMGGSLLIAFGDVGAARISDLTSGEGGGRYIIWNAAVSHLGMANLSELVFGSGVGFFPTFGLTEKASWAHNSYITLILDYGIWGVFLFFLVIVVISKRIYASPFSYACHLFLLMLFFSLSNDVFYSAEFWLFVSIYYNLGSMPKRIFNPVRRHARQDAEISVF